MHPAESDDPSSTQLAQIQDICPGGSCKNKRDLDMSPGLFQALWPNDPIAQGTFPVSWQYVDHQGDLPSLPVSGDFDPYFSKTGET
jgi:hypothetical protein